VQSQDSLGNPTNPASAETLALASSSSGGTFYSDSTCTTAITATSIATTTNLATFFYKDTKAGSPAITVTGSGAFSATVTQTETVNLAAASKLAFSQQPSTTTAGQAIAPAVTVQVQDQFGNVVTTDTSNVSITISAGGAFSSASTTTVAAVAGVATFSNLVPTKAGTFTLSASDGTLTGATSSNFSVTTTAASKLVFTTAVQTLTAGVCSTAITVQSQDSLGNPTNPASAETLALASSSSGGTFYSDSTCTTAITATSIATTTNLATFFYKDTKAGSPAITVTGSGAFSATVTQTETVSAGTATHFAVTAPTAATAGTAFNYTVTAQDQFNNTVTLYSGTVHFTSSDTLAVLPGDSAFIDTNGTRTFQATLKTAGSQTITATDTVTAAITGTSNAIAVSAAAATHFAVTAPTTAMAGASFNYTVTAEDALNNTVTSYTGTVHFTSSDPLAVLPANSTLTNGTGTFPATLKTLGSQTITATDTVTATITGTSNAITVSAAAATHFAVTAPTTATAGASFNYTVTAEDQFNNTVTTYAGTVHFSSSDPLAVLPGNFPFSGGTGTFAATLKTVGSQTITAADTTTATITGTSNAITVSAAAATSLTVAGFPNPTTAGVPGSFAVSGHDAFNNIATGYRGTVHFTSSDGSATLPADYAFTATDSGMHIFSATLNTVGSQTITATDMVNATITGTSNAITVNASGSPTVTLSATSLNYASQPVGTPSTTQPVTVANTSPTLALTNLNITATGDFGQTNNCGTGLAAQSSCMIMVTFTPTATGTRTGTIMISDNAAGSPQMVSLTGIGINAPAITLLPGSLVFSSRLVGSSSPAQTVSMSNSGNATLNIASIAITGANAGDFSQSNTCGQTLAPSASCTISVIFKPTASGQRTAGVAITSDARGSVPVVTLSGTGLAVGLDLSTSLLIFDNQTVSTTSAPQTVTLSNSGATAAAITSITATGDYAQTNNCGSSLAASSNCAIHVTFTPTGTGTRTGSISIVSGDSSTPLMVNLTGTGVVVTLSLSPASLTFNDQKVGTSSQAQSIALMDTGGAPLAISSIVPSGDFLETDNCGNGVAAGATCSINVTFLPTATGMRTGSITITSNAQGSPHTVRLTGNGISRGPAVSLTCASGGAAASTCTIVTFPAQPVTTTSGAQVVTLTNSGNDTLNITGVMATGEFTASTCPATLAASASCSINVTFKPISTGTRLGSLVIADNAGDSPQSVSLMGTGTPFGPAISLSATALPFGNQFVGSTSSKQSVTVTNTGSAMVTLTSIKASGDFAETDTCANGIPAKTVDTPNNFCTISVTFSPTATGARAGAITISDNAPASPQAVTMSGEGTDVIISVAPGGSTSATVSAGQSAAFSLLLSPSGGFSDTVTVSCGGTIPAGTCLPSSSSLTVNAPVMVTMTVTTTAPSHSTILPVRGLSPRNFGPLRAILQMLLLLVAFLLFSIAALRRRRSWIVVTASLFIFAFMSGCAGGSTNPGVVGPTVGTPSNTYTVTVVVTTTSGATRTMPLTVIVH